MPLKLEPLSAAQLPLVAAAVFAAPGATDLSPDALGAIYWANVAAQVLGGGAAYVMAARRASSRPRRQEVEPARVA